MEDAERAWNTPTERVSGYPEWEASRLFGGAFSLQLTCGFVDVRAVAIRLVFPVRQRQSRMDLTSYALTLVV